MTAKLSASPEKADNLIRIGDYYLVSEFDESFKYLQEGLALSQEIQYPDGISKAYNSLTVLHTEFGAYQIAMEYSPPLIEASLATGNGYRIGNAYLNSGNIYLDINEYEKARELYLKSIPYFQQIDNPSSLGVAELNLGYTYDAQNKLDSAKYHFQRAMEIFQKMENRHPYMEAACYLTLGNLDIHDQNYAHATLNYEKAMDMAIEAGDSIQLAQIHLLNAKALAMDGKFDLAEKELAKGRQMGIELDATHLDLDYWNTLSILRESQGQLTEALEAYRQFHSLSDSVAGATAKENIGRIQMVFDSERKSHQIEQLQKEGDAKKRINYFLGIGLGLVLLLVALQVRNARKQRRLNQQLKEANLHLQQQALEIKQQVEVQESLNEELNGLIQVVAHDLKAPINNTLSLLAMLDQTANQPDMQAMVKEKIIKVNTGAKNLIQDLLDLNRSQSTIGQESEREINISALIQEQVEHFQQQADQKQIQLVFESLCPDQTLLTKPTAWARVVDNLVSNALKFSHAGKQVKVITRVSGGKFDFEVRDEGQGIHQRDFDKVFRKFARLEAQPTGGESSTGLGLSIVKALVTNLGGDISFQSEWGKGTTFMVTVPIQA